MSALLKYLTFSSSETPPTNTTSRRFRSLMIRYESSSGFPGPTTISLRFGQSHFRRLKADSRYLRPFRFSRRPRKSRLIMPSRRCGNGPAPPANCSSWMPFGMVR